MLRSELDEFHTAYKRWLFNRRTGDSKHVSNLCFGACACSGSPTTKRRELVAEHFRCIVVTNLEALKEESLTQNSRLGRANRGLERRQIAHDGTQLGLEKLNHVGEMLVDARPTLCGERRTAEDADVGRINRLPSQ